MQSPYHLILTILNHVNSEKIQNLAINLVPLEKLY